VHITSPNTTFPTLLSRSRPAFGLLLLQVDRNVGMVDQHKEGGRPLGLPQSLKLSYIFFYDGRMADRKKRNDDSKRLTRVLSTKLSIEDFNLFRVMTNIAYQYKAINQDRPSEMLRFFVAPVVDGVRKQPGFLLL
jgi:hypothetical protein